jgi:microcystin-dependent protein
MLKKFFLPFGAIVAAALAIFLMVPRPSSVHAATQFAGQSTYITTVGGTANAITLTVPNVTSSANLKVVPVTFVPAGPNTGPAAVNINGLGAVSVLRISSLALGGGEINNIVTIFYTGAAFLITTPQDMTPPGTAIDIRGSSAPTGYLIEDGSCVSQTTYAALFSVISTTYGSCSAGLFAIPDSRGTMFAALDGQGANGLAGRITTSSCSAPNAIGICGHDTQTLTAPQLPSSIPYTDPGHVHLEVGTPAGGASNHIFMPNNGTSGVAANSAENTLSSVTGITINPSGGNAHPILPPISLGRRAIKY